MSKQQIANRIREQVTGLAKSPRFGDWLKEEKPGKEGLVLINSSFLFRKLKTTKSGFYLAIPVKAGGQLLPENLKVATGPKFNSDFKFFPTKSPVLSVEDLTTAIDRELKKLGSIVMVLIGDIDDTVQSTEDIGHSLFSKIVLDPTAKQPLTVSGKVITIKSASDEEALWDELGKTHKAALPGEIMEPFATAVEKLRQKDHAILSLPTKKTSKGALLDSFVSALKDSAREYKDLLNVCKGLPSPHANEFNNLLRIAYNFASDTVRIIRLLVSVCDLKPIVRWCTVEEWFKLEDAFKTLPWSRLKVKPSLETYQKTINSARNRAFHYLLPVNKTLQLELDGKTLGTLTLRLFSEYTSRKADQNFEYEDRALVEILTEFTRAGQKDVSPQFWQRNAEVMEKTIDLLESASSSLKLLGKS